jgi:hypothetical protein
MAKGKERRRGSRNREYYFRNDRGRFAKVNGRYVPLEHDNGDRMRDKSAPQVDVKEASHRLMPSPSEPCEEAEVSVPQVCTAQPAMVQDGGAPSTFTRRQNTLFDSCFGLPSRFIPRNGKEWPQPGRSDYSHRGFRQMSVSDLRPIHLDDL